jgi:mannosyltransferase
MDVAARPPSSWRAAVLVGALSAVLGAIALNHRSLWFDEAFNGQHSKDSWNALLHLIAKTEMSQAAYLVAIKPWVAVTSNSEVWLRIPSVASAALAAGLLVPLGARLFDRTTGIVAGVLLATNQILVAWSQQARTYALVTLAVVAASLLFLRALDDPRRRNWLLYAVAAAVAVYCHFFAGFVIVAHLASLPLAPTRPPRRRVLEAAAALLVLIAPALFFTLHADRTQLGWIPKPSPALVQRVLETATGHSPALALAVVGGLVVLAFQLGEGAPRAAWRLAFVGGWITLPVVLGLLVSVVHQRILVERYLIVIAPALALAGAVLVVTLAHVRREAGVLALVVLIAVSGYQISRWYRGQIEDWRDAVEYVRRERGPNDAVVVGPKWAIDAFRYYDPTTPVPSAPPTGRTFMFVRASDEGDVPDVITGVLTPANQLEPSHEEHFGRRLRVVVLDPPR